MVDGYRQSTGEAMMASRWFRCARRNANAALRLLCLPHAGGAASAYAAWHRYLPSNVEVWALQLPGRENRLSEPAYTDWAAIISNLANVYSSIADLPVVCFGHSMGTLLAFELARYLRLHRRSGFCGLILSGHRAPHLPSKSTPIHQLPDDEFIPAVAEFEGLPATLAASVDFREVWLPSLRADFTLCERYHYSEESPLTCAITVLGGVQDAHVRPSDLRAWAEHTQSAFRMHLLPGGHFYLHEQRERFLQLLSMSLTAYANVLPSPQVPVSQLPIYAYE